MEEIDVAEDGLLSGTFVYTMDPKGRVIMPRRFRERLGVPFVLTKGIGGCLLAMSRERWQPLVDRYSSESIIFQRFYLAGAVE
ncbi:MAG TPA: MraZ N-terminal domain-containing protein, partial [Armatimonadota bacterium]|nr:MraZ N-terminal domain-containing protein [Armatimonadota bacterium]